MPLPASYLSRLPAESLLPVQALVAAYPELDWQLSKPRKARLGTYTSSKPPVITVNSDLAPEPFLITLLHELAHHQVHLAYKRRQPPHGTAWKRAFGKLLADFAPFLPPEWQQPVLKHSRSPKATLGADLALARLMGGPLEALRLADLEQGQMFTFRGRTFQAQALRRTRRMCLEPATGKQYLISGAAEVALPHSAEQA